MFKYSYNNKRYHTLDYYYKNRFNEKVFKVSLNAGFSCPNIDGTVGYGGCIYCSKTGSGEFAGNKEDAIEKQFNEIKNTKAVIVSILSANGSANFPKLVTKFLERAICPSKKSVIDATAKITAANT